jgi:hypothetical protein
MEQTMKCLAVTAMAGFVLAGASTLASAQVRPTIDCSLSGNAALAACQNQGAVVNHGSGAVGTLGTGETTGSVGIGGSGAATPPNAIRPNSGSGVIVLPPRAGGNAVVNQGSGAVNPLGPGESSTNSGIGGSGTSAPRQ